jgi:hypothetical protein
MNTPKFTAYLFLVRLPREEAVGSSERKEIFNRLQGVTYYKSVNLPSYHSQTWNPECALVYNFFSLALQPNSGLGRLHENYRFTSVTTSRTVGRTPWTADQLVARPHVYANTEKRKHNTNTKHPYPKWDSKPRSRRPSGQRQFMP